MENSTRTLHILSSIGLAIGAGFGMAGSMTNEPILQNCEWEISSVGMISACALLTMKYFRSGNDFLAAGFFLLAIGEAVMSGGTVSGLVGAQPTFAAGMALYIPALWLISFPNSFAIWIRIAGVAASIPFAIASSKIFLGEQVLGTASLPGAGYGILTIAFIGWILTLLREKNSIG